ncbi:MAG: PQQ-dependent sugar dehydrogenase [Actinobacteria bacterium]|nr:PQQ-dependent sugar dehydrogenase [Actinomycetota bacterium]
MGKRTASLLLLGLVAASAACGSPDASVVGGDGSQGSGLPPGTAGSTTPSTGRSAGTSASPTAGGDLDAARIRLAPVTTLDQPLAMAVREGDDSLYFAEQGGRVIILRDGADPEALLDLSADITAGGEQGLLGLAFSPAGDFLYLNYTDLNGDTQVVEFAMGGDGVVPGSRRPVLSVDQPYANHNGGNLAFGPDGMLYIGLGDGGSGGDPHGNGQSLDTLLGKMLRIDPRPADGMPYGIPPDNPFVDSDSGRPEIWAYGLRNPWRYSFDRETGDLWIGDVGQSAVEEIDFEPAGAPGGTNYGWNWFEGTRQFFPGDPPSDTEPPIYEYAEGCAVTGGYVYRGTEIPELGEAYVFADFCGGELTALRQQDGRVVAERSLGITVPNLASFGEDADGELYAISLGGEVSRIEPA